MHHFINQLIIVDQEAGVSSDLLVSFVTCSIQSDKTVIENVNSC